ncbi:EDD domain protein, DegV family [Clostridium sp. USBA 49]|uniref:DegV family protein n=1 Tax=Clostridium sp. USBA 49 TaxID=1881060 RepID=UPI000999704F|nr:DegV family protein [Clostridium sp. USBA 49]SKA90675.1 EDD domain protein, DegV family [Clostridium sp. USBA 49]
METVLIIDCCCDLPIEYVEKNNVELLSLTVNINGKEYKDNLGKSLSYKDFYLAVRNGAMPSTSQINVFDFEKEFRKHVSLGKAIIYIAFSSALSGTYNSACIAKENILEEYKDADITIIDSRCASLGEGLLDYYAIEMLKNGASKEEIVNWVEENKLKVNHWFTVDDLNHLKRGGRVSETAAAIGTILDIKPIMHVDDEGKLIPVTKVKGRKKSIKTLAEELNKRIINPEEQIIFISHGDCIEDAKFLEKLILEKHKVKDVIINNIGPIIGSHAGPGTIAVFFIGEKR